MKAFGSLLLYYYTWRSVVLGTAVLGLVFLALAFNAMIFSPFLAFTLALLAYVCLLLVPYMSAPWALRKIIGSRGLAMVPWLPFAAGSALFLLTLAAAAFLPLAGWVMGTPAMTFWFSLKVFILASLYAGLLQVVLTSRHIFLKSIVFNFLPLASIALFSFHGAELLAVWANTTVVSVLSLMAFAGWAYALRVLATQRNFKPVFTGAETDRDMWIAVSAKLLGINRNAAANPVGTLLLAYPASLSQRLVNIGYTMVFTPLLMALFVQFTDEDGAGPLMGVRMFLMTSLFLTLFVSWLDGETVARARLIWLRTPGGRPQVWHRLERELWTGHLLKAGIATMLAVIAALISDIAGTLLLHFPLVIFTISLYESYLNLCARLYQWSSLPQSVAMLLSIAAIGVAAVYAARFTSTNIALLLEFALFFAGMLFRTLSKRGFTRVDWQILRHAVSKRAEAVSA